MNKYIFSYIYSMLKVAKPLIIVSFNNIVHENYL